MGRADSEGQGRPQNFYQGGGVQPVANSSNYYSACILKKKTDAPPTILQKTI